MLRRSLLRNNHASAGAKPGEKLAKHPSGVNLVFDDKWHTYKFAGKRLASVSSVLNKYFPFDSQGVAARVAEKEGRRVEDVLAGWKRSTVLGKNVHAHIESMLLNEPRRPIGDLHGDEAAYYPAASVAANSIAAHYETIGVEVMICSPRLRIAGTIDFLGRNRKTGAFCIMDWKTTAGELGGFRFGAWDAPCPAPLSHLVNAKPTRYALQVLIYGKILREEGYASIYGAEMDTLPLEYGIIQIGRDQELTSAAEYTRVEPEALLPADPTGEMSPELLIMNTIRG